MGDEKDASAVPEEDLIMNLPPAVVKTIQEVSINRINFIPLLYTRVQGIQTREICRLKKYL